MWSKAINSIFSNKEKKDETDTYSKKWHIFVTSFKFLNDSFKHLFKFPFTKEEEEEKQLEEENRIKEHLCVNCDRKYIEDENKVDSCSYHPNLLICKLSTNKTNRGLTKEQVLNMARDRPNEEIIKEYVYYCCLKAFDSDGCTKDKHSNCVCKTNNGYDTKEKQTWKSYDGKYLFFKKSDKVWLNKTNNEFQFQNELYDELVLYDQRERIYLKLTSEFLTQGVKIDCVDKRIATGKWIY